MEAITEKTNKLNIEKTLICNKGNLILESYNNNNNNNNNKCYSLTYDLNNLNPNKVNIKSLLDIGIYELLEKINPDLIEKIYILNKLNENETDICMIFKHIAKEIGIKQKYIIFRTSKIINNNTIIFDNKDLNFIDSNIENNYLTNLDLNRNLYEKMIFNYGKTEIVLNNINYNDLDAINLNINLNFSINFQILINDDLPIYMENMIGLMFKKIFYNLKQFIDNINK